MDGDYLEIKTMAEEIRRCYVRGDKRIVTFCREHPEIPLESWGQYELRIAGYATKFQISTAVPEEESPIYWPIDNFNRWDYVADGDRAEIDELIESILHQEQLWDWLGS